MTAVPVITVEMENVLSFLRDPDGVIISDPDSYPIEVPGWGDITTDVLQVAPITYFMGNRGHEIDDRMADVGTLTMALNNSAANSQSTASIYSPDHGNATRLHNAPSYTLNSFSFYLVLSTSSHVSVALIVTPDVAFDLSVVKVKYSPAVPGVSFPGSGK